MFRGEMGSAMYASEQSERIIVGGQRGAGDPEAESLQQVLHVSEGRAMRTNTANTEGQCHVHKCLDMAMGSGRQGACVFGCYTHSSFVCLVVRAKNRFRSCFSCHRATNESLLASKAY